MRPTNLTEWLRVVGVTDALVQGAKKGDIHPLDFVHGYPTALAAIDALRATFNPTDYLRWSPPQNFIDFLNASDRIDKFREDLAKVPPGEN